MDTKNITLRNKLEPWFVLISFFLLSGLVIMVQFKLEETYHFHLSNLVTNAIAGITMFLLICFFFIYYLRKFKDFLTIFKFSLKSLFTGLFLPFLILFLGWYLPTLVILKDFLLSDLHFNFYGFLKMVVPIVIAPILEEIFFRGILQRLFVEYYSPFWAIVLCGLSFAVIHLAPLPGQTLFGLFMDFFARWFHGILLSAVTYKTKNLSFAFGFHIANNFLAFLTD
jgi:membrane protease YdiL (CAAX protease family)